MAEPPCSYRYGDRIVIRGCPVKLMSFRPCEKAVTCQTKNKKIKLRTFIKYDEPHPAYRIQQLDKRLGPHKALL